MIAYPKAQDIQGAIYIGTWGDSQIPVIDVPNMHALNQLVGYVKHINAGNGTVLYRGQCELFKYVNASIVRDKNQVEFHKTRLEQAKDRIRQDDPCLKYLGLRQDDVKGWNLYQSLVIEAVLQHYGAKTFCVDFVDNHWTALWFGLNKWDAVKNKYVTRNNSGCAVFDKEITLSDRMQKKTYPVKPTYHTVVLSDSKMRELSNDAKHGSITLDELVRRNKNTILNAQLRHWNKEIQEIDAYNERIEEVEKRDSLYLFLYVADTNVPNLHGVYIGENTFTMDLRKLVPSLFLRPCSQHGWIVRGRQDEYDFNANISCVVRISVDVAKEILGGGKLLTQENFFPNDKIDEGYKILLERQEDSRLETKHSELLPPNMITDFGA